MAGPVKQPVHVNFNKGLNEKLDKWQLPFDNFENLVNSNFNKIGMLQKRNGYQQLGGTPPANTSQVSILNNGLLASGDSMGAYSEATGEYQPIGTQLTSSLSTQSILKNSQSIIGCDAVTASGLTCTVWTTATVTSAQSINETPDNFISYYQITDAVTGSVIVPMTSVNGTNASFPRVYVLGNYFAFLWISFISTLNKLQFASLPIAAPATPLSPTTFSTEMIPFSAFVYGGYDAQVSNGVLHIAFIDGTGAGALKIFNINSSLSVSSTVTISGVACTTAEISVIADQAVSGNVWYAFTQGSNFYPYVACYTAAQVSVLGATELSTSTNYQGPWAMTGVVKAGSLNLYFNSSNQGGAQFNNALWMNFYLQRITVTTGGTVTLSTIFQRGCGLVSRAFLYNGTGYVIVAYGFNYNGTIDSDTSTEPTYFLIDENGNTIGKIAPGNGFGYTGWQIALLGSTEGGSTPADIGSNVVLCNVTQSGNTISFPYIISYEINVAPIAGGLVNQYGINYGTIVFHSPTGMVSVAQSSHISGTILNQFDNANLVEHSFCVYPEGLYVVDSSTSNGSSGVVFMYLATYEWTDNNGLIHRSNVTAFPTSYTTNSKDALITVPTLRFTSKIGVRIVIYRWTATVPIWTQITSVTNPLLNDRTIDFVQFTDAYVSIGNQLYTTGGVVGDDQAPACFDPTEFHDRTWITTAEDTSLLWFSKQNIEGVPVEWSALFTYFVPPTASDSGGVYCKFGMDDRMILFKKRTILYFTGYGPDNTGANSDLSDPTEVVTPTGCTNRNSLVLIPTGILFQASDNSGIWLLDRSLNCTYKGYPVDASKTANVVSALLNPGTTQVRFHMDDGSLIMYDFLVDQWGYFENEQNNFGTASVIYKGLHTYVDASGNIQQETPGAFLDQSNPVLMSFLTGWLTLAGLQGYQRAYWFYMLANYLSPVILLFQIFYDYATTASQSTTITPTSNNPMNWKVNLDRQTCSALQISFQEQASGTPGAGLTMSGLNIIAGVKKGGRNVPGSQSTG